MPGDMPHGTNYRRTPKGTVHYRSVDYERTSILDSTTKWMKDDTWTLFREMTNPNPESRTTATEIVERLEVIV